MYVLSLNIFSFHSAPNSGAVRLPTLDYDSVVNIPIKLIRTTCNCMSSHTSFSCWTGLVKPVSVSALSSSILLHLVLIPHHHDSLIILVLGQATYPILYNSVCQFSGEEYWPMQAPSLLYRSVCCEGYNHTGREGSKDSSDGTTYHWVSEISVMGFVT